MLDLDANPRLRRLHVIAHYRVTIGFVVAAIAFWRARPTGTTLWAGATIALMGEAIRVWAAGHLRKNQEVTTSGPYRYTRHPLYWGSLILGIGFAVAAADYPVGVLILVYLAVTFYAATQLEAATLRDEFGTVFDEYANGSHLRSHRPFSLRQALENGEHQALLGFAAALAVLGLKFLFSGGAPGTV